MKQLSQLTGQKFVTGHGGNRRAMVSFERPEMSRCLDGLDGKSDACKKAIALIRTGAERLKQKPRADMAGFQPAETDVRRVEKYLARRRVETANRAAIREGRKVYDRDFE